MKQAEKGRADPDSSIRSSSSKMRAEELLTIWPRHWIRAL